MKIRRIIRRLKPIKGQFAWEVQIGPWILFFAHTEWNFGRFHVTKDPFWNI